MTEIDTLGLAAGALQFFGGLLMASNYFSRIEGGLITKLRVVLGGLVRTEKAKMYARTSQENKDYRITSFQGLGLIVVGFFIDFSVRIYQCC